MPAPHFTYEVRVQQIDTDCSGAAQVPAWIRWMEETEYAFLRSLGLSVSMRDDRGQYGFPRLTAAIQVFQPAIFDQLLTIGLTVAEISGKQIDYLFVARRSNDQKPDVVATGRFLVACCRFPAGALPYAILIPENVLECFENYRNAIDS